MYYALNVLLYLSYEKKRPVLLNLTFSFDAYFVILFTFTLFVFCFTYIDIEIRIFFINEQSFKFKQYKCDYFLSFFCFVFFYKNTNEI